MDSGDLAYLSKKVRKALDAAGMQDCKIVVSNSIDEQLIQALNIQGAKIDSFGVGERLITSKSEPVFGGVYKLAAVQNSETKEFEPRIKISENVEKIINPGRKKLFRVYDENHLSKYDVVALYEEELIPKEPQWSASEQPQYSPSLRQKISNESYPKNLEPPKCININSSNILCSRFLIPL